MSIASQTLSSFSFAMACRTNPTIFGTVVHAKPSNNRNSIFSLGTTIGQSLVVEFIECYYNALFFC